MNVNTEACWWVRLKKKDLLDLAILLSKNALPVWNNFNFPPDLKEKIKQLPQNALSEITTSVVEKNENEHLLNNFYASFITPVIQFKDGDLNFPYEVKSAFLSVFDILKGMLSTRNTLAANQAFSSSIKRSLDAIKISNLLTAMEISLLTDKYLLRI